MRRDEIAADTALLRRSLASGRFTLPVEPYGSGRTERCVETPWALAGAAGARRLLDVGYAHAEPAYADGLRRVDAPEVYGLDLVQRRLGGVRGVVGDLREAPFRDGFFDRILCISTIEHVGCSADVYGVADVARDEDGDIRAAAEIGRMLAPGGRALVSVPFGAPQRFEWMIQYDAERLARLVEATGLASLASRFFGYAGDGWRETDAGALSGARYGEGAPAAAGVALLELERP
ncbi:MAG TPA: methyltransferase domain-containing protein [Miltoncostaeaceae bacterium]|nr:methyltransferase domain-containing protein [Miltoncostaeaceae bacterium]